MPPDLRAGTTCGYYDSALSASNATAELLADARFCMDEQSVMADDLHDQSQMDPGLRRMMKWVFGALVLTVLLAILVVEFTLRWFGHP